MIFITSHFEPGDFAFSPWTRWCPSWRGCAPCCSSSCRSPSRSPLQPPSESFIISWFFGVFCYLNYELQPPYIGEFLDISMFFLPSKVPTHINFCFVNSFCSVQSFVLSDFSVPTETHIFPFVTSPVFHLFLFCPTLLWAMPSPRQY